MLLINSQTLTLLGIKNKNMKFSHPKILIIIQGIYNYHQRINIMNYQIL